MSFALKKQIKKELLDSDWAGKVEEPAVAALANILQDQYGGQLHALYDILRSCNSELSADGKITAASVQAATARNGGMQQVELVEVTDAFSVPRLAFDPVQRKLYLNTKPRHIHATAESKHQVYLQRLLLIQQRLQRSRMFQQSHLLLPDSIDRATSVQLTDLQSLMGVFGVTRYVLGCISRSEDGRYVLEDTTGAVPLDLTAAETAAGFYTENCVVIAEGAMAHDGAFHVRALGLPPTEPRGALPLAAQRLNIWGGAGGGLGPDSEAGAMLALEEAQRGPIDRIVVLANVWLDQQEVLDSLHTLMAGFSGVPTVPAMFVLMGNFHSRAGGGGGAGGGGNGGGGDAMLGGCDVDYGIMRELFGQLAGLIDQYPRLKAESRFVFVPGPDDPGPGAILPQPPLPRCLTGELRRVLPTAVFTSNPVRLRYATQRIVLFRHDLQRRLRRRSLLPLGGTPDGTTNTDAAAASKSGSPSAAAATAGPSPTALWGHLSLTLLQQGHLAPLPLLAQPVYWQYDSALSLYPLPDAVILADATAGQEDFVHDGCHVINPGCLPGGFFAAYLPCVQQVEMSELPRPGQGGDGDEEGEEEGDGEVGAEGGAGDGAAEGALAREGALGEEEEEGVGRAKATAGDPPLAPQPRSGERGPRAPVRTNAAPKPAVAVAGKAQKLRQSRTAQPKPGAGGRGRGRTVPPPRPRPTADAHGTEGADMVDGADGHVGVPETAGGEDMLIVEAEMQVAAAEAPGGCGGGRGRGKGHGKGRGNGAAVAATVTAAKGQGTLAQAWAKQPAQRPQPGSAAEEGGRLGDVDVEGRVMGLAEDVEMGEEEEEEEEMEGQLQRQRQQRARKRRAMIIEEGEEGEEEEEGGQGGKLAGRSARTWLDEEEEDWQEQEGEEEGEEERD